MTNLSFAAHNYTTESVATAESRKGRNHFVDATISGVPAGIYTVYVTGTFVVTENYDYDAIIGPGHHVTLNVGNDNPSFDENNATRTGRNWQFCDTFKMGGLYFVEGSTTINLATTTLITARSGVRDANAPIITGIDIPGVYTGKTIFVHKVTMHLIRELVDVFP